MALTTLTRDEYEQVRSATAGRVATFWVPNGVDIDYFAQPAGTPAIQRHGVITVGRLLVRQKNQDGLLRALAELDAKLWAPLRVVGSGPDEAKLRALAEDLGIARHVEFCGFISDRSQLRRLLQESLVFAMPSHYEGLPLAVLEAQAAGCRVVASDLAAFQEAVAPGAWLVPPGDVEKLRRALEVAVRERASDDEPLERWKFLARFDSRAVFDELHACLAHLASRPR